MAKKVKAIRSLTPRLKLSRNVVEIREIEGFTAGRTGLNSSQIRMVLGELREVFLHFLLMGRPVRLEDVGLFSPGIEMDGTLKISFKVDQPFIREFNKHKESLSAEIVNEENIGKSAEELIGIWNAMHPEDPVE